ncbi:RNB domain-containing ribonuclease [Sphingomonas sp.]|uniref:RNB domain-containing ribonuclease n=1 Tax=Sphingomonas sp. TaxID=28214 RepID=UPI00286A0510|nr:RNB domain-containing ribonuclease [Sphingomonas sp.]
MKTLRDPGQILTDGLAAIRLQYQLPDAFPPEVVAEAEAAVKRPLSDHVDKTEMHFVTLDPASSRDLDQAFAIEVRGDDVICHYAIADVAWFVDDGGAMDTEAWARGTSQYLPDGKVSLYPQILSEGAASLLPDVVRPAILFSTAVAADGTATLETVQRVKIRSRAKLGYESVTAADLPDGFAELERRIAAAEARRGASRSDPPEQEVVEHDGHFDLRLSPQSPAEAQNAALSLANNLAVADALLKHRTGLFRVMPEPEGWALKRLRNTAKAMGIDWPKGREVPAMERMLDPADTNQAALLLAIRHASPGASYAPFAEGVVPWHAAMAATYAHATAPLRRLADRYVVMAALAVANGQPVPPAILDAFTRLPKVMARADALGGNIQRGVIDLAEAIILKDRIGETFKAVVTDVDQRGPRIQLCGLPVVSRLKDAEVASGAAIKVRLDLADPETRKLEFSLSA